MINKFLILMFCLGISINTYSRREIREVTSSQKTIRTIYLTMGRSTILSFPEKPVKIVLGNSNYFSIEYINNDVTIQPLRKINTNMFVYTNSGKKYAILLRVGRKEKYDDIVYFKWIGRAKKKNIKPGLSNTSINKRIRVHGQVEVLIKEIIKLGNSNKYILDLEIYNLSKNQLDDGSLKVFISRGGKKLKNQELFLKSKIKKYGGGKARLLLKLEKRSGFTLNVEAFSYLGSSIIGRQYL